MVFKRWIFPDTGGKAICVYPISGQYGLLPRVLYYLLYTLLLIAHRSELVQLVALVSVMTFSGVTAIHAFILLHSHGASTDSIDLDAVAIWPLLGIGAVATVPILMWSPIARKSDGIPVIVYWGILQWFGSMGIVLLIWIMGPPIGQDICRASDNNEMLLNPYMLKYQPNRFNCTYTCFQQGTSLRSPSEALILESWSMTGYPTSLRDDDGLVETVGYCILIQPVQMLYSWWYLSADKTLLEEWRTSHKIIFGDEIQSWGSLCRAVPYHMFCSFMVVLSAIDFLIFVALIVLVELYLRDTGFKSNDELKNVGEWSGFVAVALVIAGLLVINLHKRLKTYRSGAP